MVIVGKWGACSKHGREEGAYIGKGGSTLQEEGSGGRVLSLEQPDLLAQALGYGEEKV